MKNFRLYLSLFLSFVILSCGKNYITNTNRVVVGIDNDIESLNPLYSFNLTEGYLTDLLYLSLVHHNWDNESGSIITSPMLAENWQWNIDSSSITIELRTDVKWSDGKPVTTADIPFSYDLYSDPVIESKFFGTFDKFFTDAENRIVITKTFEIISPYKIKINFKPGSAPDLFAIDLPILPKHIFEKIDRKNIAVSEIEPVTDGPFLLKKWDKNQSITLTANTNSFLYNKENLHEIIFKVIPDYNSQLMQLKNGEIDILTNLNPDDISDIKSLNKFKIEMVKGREYDYLGWNNIDPISYEKSGKIIPNRFFGNPEIRKALTHSLNRREVIENYLAGTGELASGPIAPVFKNLYDRNLTAYDYDPVKARAILEKEGWKPSPKDGILEKDGKRFSFKIFMGGSNPRREYALAIFQNNLKSIGIESEVEKMEMGSFITKLYNRQMNAWIAGWAIPIPIDLKRFWHSDLKNYPLNFAGYSNKQVDKLLLELDKNISNNEKYDIYKRIQSFIHFDEPFSFLYWIDKVVVYNNKIKNIQINPLGAINNCWEWRLD